MQNKYNSTFSSDFESYLKPVHQADDLHTASKIIIINYNILWVLLLQNDTLSSEKFFS